MAIRGARSSAKNGLRQVLQVFGSRTSAAIPPPGAGSAVCVMQDAPEVDEEDRQAIRDTRHFLEVNRPTYSYGLLEAIADRHLVPYEIYRAVTARTAATEGCAVARSQIDWNALDEPSRAELETLFAENDSLVVDPTALERKFTIPERNRAMVREFREVLENGYTGPNSIRRAPDWGRPSSLP
jgi:type I restriction enzyme R subunit